MKATALATCDARTVSFPMVGKKRRAFSNHWKSVFLLISVLCFLTSVAANAADFYVWTNSPDDGPGTAWTNAFRTIQGAVNAAANGDSVLVTNGVYDVGGAITPGYALTNRVCITNAIALESVNGREVTSIVGASDNGTNGPAAVRCVYLEGGATLGGFTLTNGHTLAAGDYAYEKAGGGAFIPTNCVMSNCTLSGNSASGNGGGAVCFLGGRVHDCTLIGNTADSGGGAGCYFGGVFENCMLNGNTAEGSGGACFMHGGGTFNNCTMTDNWSPSDGGGAYCYMGGTFNRCVLNGNTALHDGGGTYSYFGGEFNNCMLSGNTASNNGGGGYVMYCGATFDNCTMVGNSATNDGGGVYCDRGGWIHNTIIWSNTAGVTGANWYTDGVDPSFDYCCTTPDPGGIDNITNDPWFVDTVATNFHLLYRSPCIDSGTNLSSIITNDLDGIARPLDGDGDGTNTFDMGCYEYRIPVTLYVWTNSLVDGPGTAWTNAFHTIQGAVDVALNDDTILVTNGVYDSGSMATPGRSALNRVVVTNAIFISSVNGPLVTVISGAPDPFTSGNGTNAVRCVFMGPGVELSGFTLTNGYTHADGEYSYDLSGGGALLAHGGTLSNCVISGNGAGYYGAGVYCRNDGLVVGCTISGNSADDSGGGGMCFAGGSFVDCDINDNTATNMATGGNAYAGGVYVHETGIVRDCRIGTNRAVFAGGVFLSGGGLVDECTIVSNSAADYGGGVYSWAGGVVTNCTISGNFAGSYGAGVFFYDGGGLVTDCDVSGNSGPSYGGGLTLYMGGAVRTCAINSNSCTYAGGGVYCGWAANAVVTNCTLRANHANSRGGGVYCYAGGTVNNCTMTTNTSMYGGGLFLADGGSASHCNFINNDGGYWGGGVLIQDGEATVNDCTFTSNTADYGGGVYLWQYGTLTRCDFVANVADYQGGGVCLQRGGRVSDSTMVNNSADDEGGGIYFGEEGTASNCTIHGNWSIDGGGVFHYMGGRIVNSFIYSNSAADGGGVYSSPCHSTFDDGTGVVASCTITGNRADDEGGGVYCDSRGLIENCIVYHNAAATGPNWYNYSTGMTYASCCTTPSPGGDGHVTNAPGLMTVCNPHLITNSPCIDAGTNQAWMAEALDIDAEARLNGTVDIGCDEVYPSSGIYTGELVITIAAPHTQACVGYPLHFDAEIQGMAQGYGWSLGDGASRSAALHISHAHTNAGVFDVVVTAWNETTTGSATQTVHIYEAYTTYAATDSPSPAFPHTNWATAAHTIQEAIDANNVAGGAVLVTNGVYDVGGVVVHEGLVNRVAITNKPICVRSVNGPSATFIVGEGPSGDSAVRCVYLCGEGEIRGFTLTNGHTRTSGDYNRTQSGGGIWCAGTDNAVSNCVLTGNDAQRYGGGLYQGRLARSEAGGLTTYFYNGDGEYYSAFDNCTVSANTSSDDGGGAYYGVLNHCTVNNNIASDCAGGLCCGTASHCFVTGNSAGNDGGGTYYSTVRNSLISQNAAGRNGGGAHFGALENCTLSGNFAVENGGGTYYSHMVSCIAHGNTAAGSPNWQCSAIRYTCTTPLPYGNGNITNTPCFVDPGAGDYHLEFCAAVDSGIEMLDIPYDLDGVVRPLDGDLDGTNTYDMGCYEYAGDPHADDTDDDGLSNYDEVLTHLTDPADADTDSDGQSDYAEVIITLTDPLDTGNCYMIDHAELSDADGFVLSWVGHTGRTYTAWTRCDLTSGDWTNVTDYTDVSGIEGIMSYTNTLGVDLGFMIISVEKP